MNLPPAIAAQYQPWVRSWWLAVWALCAVLMGVVFYLGLVLGSVFLTFWGAALALAAVAILVTVWRRLRTDINMITVDADGYHDIRIGRPIPWAEIVRLVRHQPGTRVDLFIEAKEPERFVQRRHRFYKGAARIDPTLGFPGLASGLSGLTADAEDIVAAADSWHAKAQG